MVLQMPRVSDYFVKTVCYEAPLQNGRQDEEEPRTEEKVFWMSPLFFAGLLSMTNVQCTIPLAVARLKSRHDFWITRDFVLVEIVP